MKRPKKQKQRSIVMLTACGGLYGSEQAFLEILEHVSSGQEAMVVHAFVPSKGPLGEKATRINTGTGLYPLWQGGICKTISRGLLILRIVAASPTSLYLNDAGLLRSALIAVRLLKIPLTVHVRTVEEARRVKALLQKRPSLDVHVVAISQFIASVLGDTGYDTTVLYDGFSRRGLTAWPKRRDEAPFVITILGRYAISKGQPFVVDALKGGSPDLKGIPWQLRLVGVAQSEEGAALIRRKLGIDEQDKRFLVTGFTERINDVLRDTHVVAIAGVEALGRTWFEAVSAERPILIASGSGSAELANKHGVGVIYGMNSAEDFASKLRWVFNNYKVIQGAVASRKDAILNEYDMAAYVERLMAIILRPAKS